MDAELAKLLGTGGVAAALLFLLYLVGMRMVAAIDRVASKVDVHAKDDLAQHTGSREAFGELREVVIRLDESVTTVLEERDRTPVEGVPLPGGYYGPRKPRGG